MGQRPARKPALPMVSIAAAGAAAATLAVVAVPWLRSSFDAPSLRVALDTGGSLLAIATVVLLLRQCGPASRADHLWLSAGLVTLAVTGLAVAGLVMGGAWSSADARYGIAGNLAGTVMLAIAAFAPPRRPRVRRRTVWLAAAVLGLAVAVLAAILAGPGAAHLGPIEAPRPHFRPDVGRLIVQIAVAVALIVAAAGLARRARDRGEALLRYAAVAVVLAGFAKLNYALFPPVDTQAVHLGDALRVLGWIALLVGVVKEVGVRIGERSDAAIASERRRLARELHDGVAQELAFIRRRAGRLSALADGVEIVSAAERALEDSRRAIEGLVPPSDETLDVALRRHGARLAVECGLEVQVNVRTDAAVTPEVRAELLRIVAEAVRNAAHHGGARHVRVDLAGPPLSVRVIDDGAGFVPGASSGLGVVGYGLIAMRERAEQVGGELSLESVPGAGTLVQVVLP
jgi:signal transduction histidine kinase